MRKLAIILGCALIMTSCGGNGGGYASDESYYDEEVAAMGIETDMAPMAVMTDEPVDVAHQVNPAAKKIIKYGRMGVNVEDLQKSKALVDGLVAKYGAYYGSEVYNDYGGSEVFDLMIRIPLRDYEAFIAGVESGGGEVAYKNIDARDVTEQFYDLETRLANKRSYLDRYRELLRRANTIKEILEVESYIRSLEEEIESAEGRLRLMSDQVNYSTLQLTVTQEKDLPPAKGAGFFKRMGKALSAGWNGFVNLFIALFYVWPLWMVLGGAGVFVYYKVGKKHKSRK